MKTVVSFFHNLISNIPNNVMKSVLISKSLSLLMLLKMLHAIFNHDDIQFESSHEFERIIFLPQSQSTHSFSISAHWNKSFLTKSCKNIKCIQKQSCHIKVKSYQYIQSHIHLMVFESIWHTFYHFMVK